MKRLTIYTPVLLSRKYDISSSVSLTVECFCCFQNMISAGGDNSKRELGPYTLSPTTCFLKYLQVSWSLALTTSHSIHAVMSYPLSLAQVPDDPDVVIDLQQTCVLLMCHLDRLVTPYLPPLADPAVRSLTATQPACEVPLPSLIL